MKHTLAAGILLSLACGLAGCSLTDTSSLGSGGSGGTGAGGAGGSGGSGAGSGGTSGGTAREIGSACTVSEQCDSGVCADGVCCGSACAGGCEACSAAAKGSGADGVCGPVASGSDPRGNCADQGPESCGTTGSCDGAGACAQYPAATLCSASSCTGGVRTLPRQCDGSGSCVDAGTQDCDQGLCSGTVCEGQCENDAGCPSSDYCDAVSGSCTPKRPNGTTCQSNLASQCQSGICADGVCCNSDCTGPCEGCATGTCSPHRAGEDPESDCSGDAPESCGDDGMCDGSGGCRLYVAGTPCSAASCSGSTYTPPSQCDGNGSCSSLGTVACAPYVCAGNSCRTSCSSAADCAPGVTCDLQTNTCKSPLPGGAACSAPSQCQSSFCVDGRCCTTACNGPCEACSVAKRGVGLDGECGAVAAGTDPDNECTDEGAASCGQTGMCSGGLSCATYSAGTVCEAATCSGASTLRVAGTCSQGSCDPGGTTSCSPYACSGSACKTSCSLDGDCASGFYCDNLASTCKPKAPLGTSCIKKFECASGFCVDGVCCENACTGMCMTCGTDGYAQAGFCSPVECGPAGAECSGGRRCSAGSCMDMCVLLQ